jgi:hypothetical protein
VTTTALLHTIRTAARVSILGHAVHNSQEKTNSHQMCVRSIRNKCYSTNKVIDLKSCFRQPVSKLRVPRYLQIKTYISKAQARWPRAKLKKKKKITKKSIIHQQ